jgi:hypothetical protein
MERDTQLPPALVMIIHCLLFADKVRGVGGWMSRNKVRGLGVDVEKTNCAL